MNENIFSRVKVYMKTKDFSFNESWLKECVQYCVETHPKLSIEDIQSFAIEQWLLSDLREINNKNGCLPKNLTLQSCTTLNGNYILQMEMMYDISTSKYKQLEKIRKIEVQNLIETEDEKSDILKPKEKRMYQLFLTDGLQEIKAMEYKPIELFNKILLPGYKLKIIGPINSRRGIIMLEAKNICGLGGEIEQLLIKNSIENVLARSLNLKENPDPYKDTKVKEGSEKSNDDDEEYLNCLEKLARSQESKESRRSNSNLNSSSTFNLQSGNKLNLEETSIEQNSDSELEALLKDPDFMGEFSSIESKVGNQFKLPIQSSIKDFLPSYRSVKKVKFTDNSFNSEDGSDVQISKLSKKDKKSCQAKNNKKSLLSKSSDFKTDNSMDVDMGIKKTGKELLKGWQIISNEASIENSIFEDDDLIISEQSAIGIPQLSKTDVGFPMQKSFDEKSFQQKNSRKQPLKKRSYQKTDNSMNVEDDSRIEKLKNNSMKGWTIIPNEPIEDSILEDEDLILSEPSDIKISKLSKMDVDLTIQKSLFSTSSYQKPDNSMNVDEDSRIEKLENKSMKGWKIIPNDASIVKSNVLQRQTYLETKSSDENILDPKNSFGISKPFKPHFTNDNSTVTEKLKNDSQIEEIRNNPEKGLRLFFNERKNSSDDEMFSKMKESPNKPNSEIMDKDSNMQLKKFLNLSNNVYLQSNEKIFPKLSCTQSGCSYGSEKSTSKITSIASLSKFKTEIGTEEIPIESKRPAKTVLSLIKNQSKMYRTSADSIKVSEVKEQISPLNEESPQKICDFICDLIEEPLSNEPITKTVRALVQEKGILSSKDGLWQLDGSIFDGTANLKVEFSTKFMDSILGFTAREFSTKKKKLKNEPKLQEEIRRGLREGQKKLEETEWLMQLKLIENKIPLVVKASEITQEQKEVFEKRLQTRKLQ